MLRNVKSRALFFIIDYIRAMALSKRKVGLIVGLIVISLAGLIMLQGWLLNYALQLKEKTFDNNVAAALSGVTDMLETHQAAAVIIEVAGNLDIFDSSAIAAGDVDTASGNPLKAKMFIIKGDSISPDTGGPVKTFDRKLSLMSFEDTVCLTDSLICDSITLTGSGKMILGKDFLDSCRQAIHVVAAPGSDRIDFLQKVLDRMTVSETLPLEKRLDSALVDSIIGVNLKEANIDLDYVFGIKIADSDSLILSPPDFHEALLQSEYAVRLFPYDILSSQADLLLFFPDKQTFIWRQIIPVLAVIVIFISIIILCFVYTVKTILTQRYSAALMADFVNNMTHEFKTPISTISLAAEAILRSDVITDNEKVTQYSKMILDENKRMRRQAEKILQMAALEESDLSLKPDEVNLHEVINEAVDSISLAVKKRGGTISCTLNAGKDTILGDRVHISGIVHNLLDNANKYSPEKPQISVFTSNADNGIYMRIVDNGMGIKEDDLKMVFSKYYRVSSGNIHDVKGFGLGLSYVKLMVEAHGGAITMKSKYGEGTRVEVFLPLKYETNNDVKES